jgi:hypothetical protein
MRRTTKPGDEISPGTLTRAADAVLEFALQWRTEVSRCPWPPETMDPDSPSWMGRIPDEFLPFDRETVQQACEFLVRLGNIVIVQENA